MSDDNVQSDSESDSDEEESTRLDRIQELKLTLETIRTAAKLVEMLK
ncbi:MULTISPECIES: hypothetical protein [Halorubrum]|nr:MULTISPECIES: hypothetical protein [Halorubrum]